MFINIVKNAAKFHLKFFKENLLFTNFRQKVQQYKRESIFRTEGGHTFFIPVDEGFANNRAGLIDDYIIDGHVIPREVLFTTPTKKDSPFPTLANSDNVIRVIISFTQEQRDKTIINYVKSHTLFGDGKHPQGVVLAEIVKANIPVKNGVIHLIHKPLMIVDSTIKELLQEKDGGILNNFLNELNDLGPEGHSFLRTIERSQDVTLFAPCNSALDNEIVRSIKRDKQKYLEVLQMHVVVDNRLKSYELGQAQQFNAQLNATNKKFTYFIPSNKAWQTARVMMPSAIKKLFMEDFSYHAFTTLQRHLVISDDVFTMERIKQLTKAKELNQTNRANLHEPLPISLPTLRGSLEIFVEERKDNTYVIHWEELRIPVFRPNVECTNGIIHVIDMPFLKKGDIVVSSSSLNTASLIGAALAVLFARLLAE
ncbi:hypothetical protein YQE_06835, partial [Dendroctonus ponderosae]